MGRGRVNARSLLFSDGDLSDFIEQRKSRATQEINDLENVSLHNKIVQN